MSCMHGVSRTLELKTMMTQDYKPLVGGIYALIIKVNTQ